MGPGTELKRLLGRVEIHPAPNCPCDQRALLMDEQGSDWCYENLVMIVGWMREEAGNRGIPFGSIPAKLLILTAIHNARKKVRILDG